MSDNTAHCEESEYSSRYERRGERPVGVKCLRRAGQYTQKELDAMIGLVMLSKTGQHRQ